MPRGWYVPRVRRVSRAIFTIYIFFTFKACLSFSELSPVAPIEMGVGRQYQDYVDVRIIYFPLNLTYFSFKFT